LVIVLLLGVVGMEVMGQIVTCGWWLGDEGGHSHWGVVGKGAGGGGGGGQVEGGTWVVVMVVGCLDKRKKRQNKLTFFFLIPYQVRCIY
jgi:hypothetical protein